jgi:hypothetical protein
MSALAHFLECFDAYEVARRELRDMPEGDDAERRQWLDHCIFLWRQTLEARASLASPANPGPTPVVGECAAQGAVAVAASSDVAGRTVLAPNGSQGAL